MKLEKRQNPSSKVLMGLATVGAAGSASGALVQIDLIGNTITAGGGNQLNADFTGDALADLQILRMFSNLGRSGSFYSGGFNAANNVRVSALSSSSDSSYTANVNGMLVFGEGGSVDGVILVSFDGRSLGFDSAVAGVVSATAGGLRSTRGVTLNSLVFDDGTGVPVTTTTDISGAQVIGSTENGVFTPVPEPSSLALLALGAAGVVTRRQRKKAA